MLYEIMKSVNNFFEVENGKHQGNWKIEDGKISLPFLQENQYFRVEGSVFNDGVYIYNDSLFLEDEEFTGTVTALKPDKAFLKLVEEIDDWDAKNGTVGPYSSESFGGYSYSRATSSNGGAYSWKDAFKAKLRPWRKL